ncbi:MAG TPA: T9SS type A sorting domain-containing protein [Ignavibacteriaceae bacterium]|nr:T9SS type A sorting domain-containing protein [Ignavibacteriaceae bacterium]
MKSHIFQLAILLIAFQNVFAQEANIPSWPCTGSSSSSTKYINSTLTLKVILVEFSDIKHRNPSQDGLPEYTYDDFENLFFSNGIYASPNMYSPDNKQVFGSLHDYYNKMSDGNLNITGYVLNNDNNSDNIPDWIELDYNKSYYNDDYYTTFYNEVITKAIAQGLNVGGLGTYVKLAIVYAGHAYRQTSSESEPSGLTPRAFSNNYIMSEQFAPYAPYNSEHPNRNFSHIGIHAHELGHLLGFPDLYYSSNNNGWWDLMAAGNYNGPTYSGACPAPINPQLRNEKGWVSFSSISGDPTYQADYYLQDPEVFQIINSSNSNYYFLVETRKFNQTMSIGSTNCPDYNTYVPHGNKTQGVLVWRKDGTVSHGRIIHANGLAWTSGNLGNAGDILPGDSGVEVITPWSDLRTTSSTYNWIPNTTTSTNCGFEIIYEGNGYYTIDFYSQNPVQASPSYPKNLQITTSDNNNPVLTWEANIEPDISGYIIDRADGGYWEYNIAQVSTTSFIDYNVNINPVFEDVITYKIRAVDTQAKISVPSEAVSIDDAVLHKKNFSTGEIADKSFDYFLSTSYPNPFNPTTTIAYQIKEKGLVQLKVYDILGKEITVLVNEIKSAGQYTVNFDGSHLPSGVYIYSLRVNEFVQNNKMTLLK